MAHLSVLILLVALTIKQCNTVCSPVYGAKPCSFVPAHPGNSPDCAHPGITFCEYPTHYPGQLIQHLVDKWRYDHTTLLIDESRLELDNFFLSSDSPYGGHHDHHQQQQPPLLSSYGPPPVNTQTRPLQQQSSNPEHNANINPNPNLNPNSNLNPNLNPSQSYHPSNNKNSPSTPNLYSPPNPVYSGNNYIPPVGYNSTGTFTGYPDRRVPLSSGSLPQITSPGGGGGGGGGGIYPNGGSSSSGGVTNRLVSYKYSSGGGKVPYAQSRFSGNGEQPPQQFKSVEPPQINSYSRDDWNKRYNPNDKSYYYNRRRRRSVQMLNRLKRLQRLEASSALPYSNSTSSSHSSHSRGKRQSGGGAPITGMTLCESRSQYIMPRAALNNRGNWMYVVNMPEVDNRLTQLVKSETCISQQCNGLCSLPNGYSSRCEQKYVQKRLVALESGGNQLYTDVFWFPSCCICTITNN